MLCPISLKLGTVQFVGWYTLRSQMVAMVRFRVLQCSDRVYFFE